jgi:hypothetical protein
VSHKKPKVPRQTIASFRQAFSGSGFFTCIRRLAVHALLMHDCSSKIIFRIKLGWILLNITAEIVPESNTTSNALCLLGVCRLSCNKKFVNALFMRPFKPEQSELTDLPVLDDGPLETLDV